LHYGAERFERASSTLRRLRGRETAARRYGGAMRDPRGLWALAVVLARLPALEVRATGGPAGRALRRHLHERRHGVAHNRFAQGVLTLPPTFDEYLSGGRRQALRTNLRRAGDLGIVCSPVPETVDRRDLLERWLGRGRPDDQASVVNEWIAASPADAEWWVAIGRDGAPLALGVISVDAHWALLHGLVSRSHPARWMLHTRMVRATIEAGARHLCVTEGNALLLSPELQYFQRLLGYRVAHLRLRSRPRGHGPTTVWPPAGAAN
jgi:hypothetical protein